MIYKKPRPTMIHQAIHHIASKKHIPKKMLPIVRAVQAMGNNETLLVSDIDVMTQIADRNKNDANNKKRELILSTVLTLGDSYLNDPVYGERWKDLQQKWKTTLDRICDKVYDRIIIDTKAGRGHHYDFHVTYINGDTTVDEKMVEFKHNCSDISLLPQFLSLPDKQDVMESSYASYFYDHYLAKYVTCDPEITCDIPSKENYMKMVFSTNYDIHPFFRQLYDRDTFFKKLKDDVVNESIAKYLTSYHSTLDITKMSEKFKLTQKDKIFILWDLQQFHIDRIEDHELTIITNEGVKNNNTIVLKSNTCIYQMLLRWRNHKGVLLPAWQISMRGRASSKK